jgi:hypothetical protein
LPGEGVRTVAELEGDNWIINGRKKMGVLRHGVGS